jgi:hypothetical protein
MKNALIHKKCSSVVAYANRLYESGDKIESKHLQSVTGKDIPLGAIIICPFCHDNVRMWEVRQKDLDE